MIRHLPRVWAWLAAGTAVLFGLYWAFLNTPEATSLTLAVSGVLIAAMVLVTGWIVNVAILLALGESMAASARIGAKRIHWFLIAAAPVVLTAWMITRADAWIARNSGEITAWFIVRFNWADIAAMFTAERYLSLWVRWLVVPAAAVAVLTGLLNERGGRTVVRAIPRPWHWRPLLVMTVAFVALIEAPARFSYAQDYVYRLPPNWIQAIGAGLRLALEAAVLTALIALIIVVATRSAPGNPTN
jgi:hypothetical protein